MVFCVHDDSDAYLEAYADSKVAVLHRPDWVVSLNDTQHISPTICPHEQEYEFVITLHSEVVRLAAPTWDQMIDWVESLRGKLHELRILSPKENIYSKMPEAKSASLLSTRDPTSPLPPPPPVPPAIPPGVELTQRSSQPNSDVTSESSSNHPVLQRGISLPEGTNSVIESSPLNHVTIVEVESQSASQPDVFSFENLSISNTPPATSGVHYERLYHLHSPGPSTRQCNIQRSDSSPRRLQPAPQPYRTLREQQVLQLQREMKHPSGVRLQLRRKDCISSIALADAMNSVW